VSLDVHIGGLHDVAASLTIAAENLSSLAATPLIHPPLAEDEVSTSAAARLTEHAGVLASRAADGAAVLQSGAQAVLAASRTYTDMNAGNASLVGLHGDPGAVSTAAPTPAVVADLTAPFVPITPPVPRDGEVTAAIMEAGSASSGAGFGAGCDAYAGAFRGSATAVRNAQSLVSEALTGQAGPRIAAALGGFGGWSDAMAEHAATVGQAAQGHKERFTKAKQDTPTTTEFANKRQEYDNAQAFNARYGGMYSGKVAKIQSEIVDLQNRAGMAAAGYHLGELPAAPPPPPPVVPIVSSSAPAPAHGAAPDDGSDQPDPHRAVTSGDGASSANGGDASTGDPTDPTGDPTAAGLGQEGNPTGDPAGQMIPMIASMVPALLGGVVGLAASIPEQISQQVQSVASGAMQGLQGLTTAMHAPDASAVDTSIPDPGLGGLGATGDSGGGGGDTTPAAAPSLPPASGAMGAPAVTPAPLVGQSGTAVGVPAAAAGAGMGGGMPMMMPGGMGAGGSGGTRPVKEPDKSVYVPQEPNSAAVRGEVARRETAVADDPTATAAGSRKPVPAVTVSASRGRRIELPKEGGGDE
jgi:hypothetical protein